MDYKEVCNKVQEVAIFAGRFIAQQRLHFDLNKVEHKGKFDLVSYVDKESEKIVIEKLSTIVPKAGFITEEGTVEQYQTRDSGYFWVIDPLDGTTNFVHGFSPYCVSIALMCGSEVVVGVVYEITKGECFAAYKDGCATLNGSVIKVSNIENPEDSLVVGGFAHKLNSDQYKKSIETFDLLNRSTHGIRRTGSAATNLVDVAAGRAEMFFQVGLNSWDVAAGALIVQCAGGEVSDFGGGEGYIFGEQIIASNKLTHSYFIKYLV